jgi:hypothetical protein
MQSVNLKKDVFLILWLSTIPAERLIFSFWPGLSEYNQILLQIARNSLASIYESSKRSEKVFSVLSLLPVPAGFRIDTLLLLFLIGCGGDILPGLTRPYQSHPGMILIITPHLICYFPFLYLFLTRMLTRNQANFFLREYLFCQSKYGLVIRLFVQVKRWSLLADSKKAQNLRRQNYMFLA